MDNNSKIKELIEREIQVGTVFSYLINGEVCWSTLALQKFKGKYLVFYDAILELNMDAEEYLIEKLNEFQDFSLVIKYIEENTKANFGDLKPKKGTNYFNPNLPRTN